MKSQCSARVSLTQDDITATSEGYGQGPTVEGDDAEEEEEEVEGVFGGLIFASEVADAEAVKGGTKVVVRSSY